MWVLIEFRRNLRAGVSLVVLQASNLGKVQVERDLWRSSGLNPLLKRSCT